MKTDVGGWMAGVVGRCSLSILTASVLSVKCKGLTPEVGDGGKSAGGLF